MSDGAGLLRPRYETLVPLLAVVAGVILAASGTGQDPAGWYPVAVAAVAVVVFITLRPARTVDRLDGFLKLAVVGYVGFCAWGYLSLLWADAPADALDGANRSLFYGAVFALVVWRSWSVRLARRGLALFAGATSVTAIAVLAMAIGSDPLALFTDSRLAEPTGYANGAACLFLMAFWPALHLALTGAGSAASRGVWLAACCLLLELSLLTQSRGAQIALAGSAIAFLWLVRRRWASLLALSGLAGLVAFAWAPLISVATSTTPGELERALDRAAWAVVVSCVVAFAGGAMSARLGLHFRSLTANGRIRRTADRALVAGVLIGIVAVGWIGSPQEWLDNRWQSFKQIEYPALRSGEVRLQSSLGSARYDYYRVALNQLEAHPVHGSGADNFSADYLRQRRSAEAPHDAHSLPLSVLSETGLVGAMLLLIFLGSAVAAVARRLRALPDRDVGVAAAAAFLLWLVQSAGDQLWELPVITVTALAMLGIASRVSIAPEAGASLGATRRSRGRYALAAAGGVIALGLALTGAAAVIARSGYTDAKERPGRAIERFRLAARLNPLLAAPPLAEGIVERRRGDLPRARSAIERSLRRSPDDWLAHVELALIEYGDGHAADAARAMARAVELNPRQSFIRSVRRDLARRRVINPKYVETTLYWLAVPGEAEALWRLDGPIELPLRLDERRALMPVP
jgi:tetratricopeptide (TPR) repeat protein